MADPLPARHKLKPTDTARYKDGTLMYIVGVSKFGFVKARPLLGGKNDIKHYAAIDFEAANFVISLTGRN